MSDINPHNVQVGQVWEELDPAMHGRQFRVTAISLVHGKAQVVNRFTLRRSHIRLDRFKPIGTSRGYRLIGDAS